MTPTMPSILHVVHSEKLYGAEQSLLRLVEGLKKRGYKSVVVVPRAGPLSQRLHDLGVLVVFVPYIKPWLTRAQGIKRVLYNLYQIYYAIQSVRRIRNTIQQYNVDLVHTTTAVIMDGAIAARLAGVPHIWHIREIIRPDSGRNFFLGVRAVWRIIDYLSAKIIAISKAVAAPFPGDPSKIAIVYNGVDVGKFRPPSRTEGMGMLRQSFGLPAEGPLVGLLAQFDPRKRLEDFIQAAALVHPLFPDARFLILGGDIASPYGQYLQALSRQLNATDYTVWAGFLEDPLPLLQQLDIVVLPSKEEPFGLVVIEAMAVGKPVIGTLSGGIPEIIVDGETGLLVPLESPADLAQAIATLLQNPDKACAMGRAGRQRVEEHFSLDKYVENVENVYREVLR
jgi:glycosyltransferase involved in cell wall biosynthesis